MDYQVILSQKAVRDLEAIVRYIALNNPEAARKLGQRLLKKTKELSQFAFKNQKVAEFDDPNIRQIILRPYRIVGVAELTYELFKVPLRRQIRAPEAGALPASSLRLCVSQFISRFSLLVV